MIDLGTLRGLHEHQHQLAAYCVTCDRWRVLPLAQMIAAGHGERRDRPAGRAGGWKHPKEKPRREAATRWRKCLLSASDC